MKYIWVNRLQKCLLPHHNFSLLLWQLNSWAQRHQWLLAISQFKIIFSQKKIFEKKFYMKIYSCLQDSFRFPISLPELRFRIVVGWSLIGILCEVQPWNTDLAVGWVPLLLIIYTITKQNNQIYKQKFANRCRFWNQCSRRKKWLLLFLHFW